MNEKSVILKGINLYFWIQVTYYDPCAIFLKFNVVIESTRNF